VWFSHYHPVWHPGPFLSAWTVSGTYLKSSDGKYKLITKQSCPYAQLIEHYAMKGYGGVDIWIDNLLILSYLISDLSV
jgi:hypothetical protein